MTEDAAPPVQKTPLWFWIVAALATLWNFFGVLDYLLSRLAPNMYAAQMTPEQLAYYQSFPVWFTVIWAGAVWLAFIASMALLFKSRFAFILFAVSLAGFVINSIYSFGFSGAMAVLGVGHVIFSLVIFASLVALTWFSRQWAQSGLLR